MLYFSMYRIDTVKSTLWQVLRLMISQIEDQENIQIFILNVVNVNYSDIEIISK
jgi:hypothetical protein